MCALGCSCSTFFQTSLGVKQGWPVVDQKAGMAIQGLGGLHFCVVCLPVDPATKATWLILPAVTALCCRAQKRLQSHRDQCHLVGPAIRDTWLILPAKQFHQADHGTQTPAVWSLFCFLTLQAASCVGGLTTALGNILMALGWELSPSVKANSMEQREERAQNDAPWIDNSYMVNAIS